MHGKVQSKIEQPNLENLTLHYCETVAMNQLSFYAPLIIRRLTAALRSPDVGARAEPEDHPLGLGAPLEVARRLLAPLGAVAAPRRVREGVDALEGALVGRRLRPRPEHEELRRQQQPIQQSMWSCVK